MVGRGGFRKNTMTEGDSLGIDPRDVGNEEKSLKRPLKKEEES